MMILQEAATFIGNEQPVKEELAEDKYEFITFNIGFNGGNHY